MYNNRILHINLNIGAISTLKFPENIYQEYLGGTGLASYILNYHFDILPELSPENPLIVITGLLTGTQIPYTDSLFLCARSPVNGLLIESVIESDWGNELKQAGYDGIIIVGRAKEPVYLWINNSEVKILPAGNIWLKDNYETYEKLLNTVDTDAKILSIGPAGENCSYVSNIVVDKLYPSSSGFGALMGFKNLKAIVVKGTEKNFKIDKNLESFSSFINRNSEILSPVTQLKIANNKNFLPVKNFNYTNWNEGIEQIINDYSTLDTQYQSIIDYTNLCSFGSLIFNKDINKIVEFVELSNKYGLCPIAISNVIAFIMDCYENKVIDKKFIDNIEAEWGNTDSVLKLIEIITFRQNIGDILSYGTKFASEKLGIKTNDYALHYNGLELSMFNPINYPYLTLDIITSNNNSFYGYTLFNDTFKVSNESDLINLQNYTSLFNSLGLSNKLLMLGLNPELLVDLLNYTGYEINIDKLLKIGENTFNLKQNFNSSCGASTSSYKEYPKKLFKEIDLEQTISNYYKLRNQ